MRIIRRPDQGKGDGLLYLGWITNKTYCIEHGTVLSVMCQPGWEGFGGEWIHVYVWLTPLAVHLKLPLYVD